MIEVIADRTNELQYKDIIGGQGIVWVWSNDLPNLYSQ